MNTPERRWQGSLRVRRWVLTLTLGYRQRNDVWSATVSVSWCRSRVEQ
jgi:hypothetical protein